jgi:hypothetical protein
MADDDDTREREAEKREAHEKQTEQHAPADRDDKGDRGEEAVREGVTSTIPGRSD